MFDRMNGQHTTSMYITEFMFDRMNGQLQRVCIPLSLCLTGWMANYNEYVYHWVYVWQDEWPTTTCMYITEFMFDRMNGQQQRVYIYIYIYISLSLCLTGWMANNNEYVYHWVYVWQDEWPTTTSIYITEFMFDRMNGQQQRVCISLSLCLTGWMANNNEYVYHWVYVWQDEWPTPTSIYIYISLSLCLTGWMANTNEHVYHWVYVWQDEWPTTTSMYITEFRTFMFLFCGGSLWTTWWHKNICYFNLIFIHTRYSNLIWFVDPW